MPGKNDPLDEPTNDAKVQGQRNIFSYPAKEQEQAAIVRRQPGIVPDIPENADVEVE